MLASVSLLAQVGMTHKWTFFLHKLTHTVAFTECVVNHRHSHRCRDDVAVTTAHTHKSGVFID